MGWRGRDDIERDDKEKKKVGLFVGIVGIIKS